MSAVAFLIDENMSNKVADALRALEPAAQIGFIGDGTAPPKKTKDPEVLKYAEENNLAVVTHDITSMPVHVEAHLASGHHTCGVLYFPDQSLSPGRIADELLVVWACSTPEEWVDKPEWFPL